MGAVLEALKACGAAVERQKTGVRVCRDGRPHPLDLTTLPYPGFPTDLQAPFTSILSLADGMSVVTEKIYPERFMHVPELARMGADIRTQGPSAIVHGVPSLDGAQVMASDIRGGAALLVAGLAAKGATTVHRIYHVDRGYEKVVEKLTALGARLRRVDAE
jgi:UDP-N-acetylglucosamine 1-carboxyvinyltransferase